MSIFLAIAYRQSFFPYIQTSLDQHKYRQEVEVDVMENALQESIKEIDINPIILSGSRPIAVDALVVLIPKTQQ